MMEKEWQKAIIGQVVQFTENHKWCGALGFISEVKKCGHDYWFMIGCTMANNQTACDTAYIYSMANKKEFEPLLDGHVVLMPKGGEDWEDYEESKEYWNIDWTCTGVTKNKYSGDDIDDFNKSIGNFFETEEEAEKAVKKLEAFKRLKDKGFRFERWGVGGEYGNTITFSDYIEYNDETRADLDLVFGGEND